MLVSLVPTPELDLSKRIRGLRGGGLLQAAVPWRRYEEPHRDVRLPARITAWIARCFARLACLRDNFRADVDVLAGGGSLIRRTRTGSPWNEHRLALRRVVRRQPIRGVEQHHFAGTLRTTTHHPVLHWWHDHSPVQSSRGSVGRASTIFIVSTDTRVTRLIKSTM